MFISAGLITMLIVAYFVCQLIGGVGSLAISGAQALSEMKEDDKIRKQYERQMRSAGHYWDNECGWVGPVEPWDSFGKSRMKEQGWQRNSFGDWQPIPAPVESVPQASPKPSSEPAKPREAPTTLLEARRFHR
jgi:hypothetical protein